MQGQRDGEATARAGTSAVQGGSHCRRDSSPGGNDAGGACAAQGKATGEEKDKGKEVGKGRAEQLYRSLRLENQRDCNTPLSIQLACINYQ